MRDPALPPRTPKKREALPDVLAMGELERLLAYEHLRENALLLPERLVQRLLAKRSPRRIVRAVRDPLQPSSASTRHMWSSAP